MDSKLEIVLAAKDITGAAFTKLTGRIDKVKKSVFSLQGGLVTLAGGYGLKAVASGALDVASSFEKMEIKLDVLTRGKGRQTLEDLNAWALEMPVNTQKAVDTFTMMQAMGLDPTIAKMETLVDVASIFGEEAMPRVARALGQMQSLGKLTAQDLNQMAEVGINARKYLKDAFGMTVEEIQKSGIEINKVVESIWQGLDADYAGAAKQAQTSWQGLTATFKSYMVEISREVMDAGVFEELKTQLGELNRLTSNWLQTNRELIKVKVPEYIDNIKNSIGGIIDTYNAIPNEIKGAAGYGILGAILFGKKGAFLTALASVSYDFGKNFGNLLESEQATTNEAMWTARIKELQDLIAMYEKGNMPGKNLFIEKYQTEIKLLQDKLYLLTNEREETEKLTVAASNYNKQVEKRIIQLDTIEVTAKRIREDMWKVWGVDQIFEQDLPRSMSMDSLSDEFTRINGMLEKSSDEMKDTLVDTAGELQEVYVSLASIIRDTLADAFYDVAKTGKVEMENLADTIMRTGSQITANSAMQGSWQGMAIGGAMMFGGSYMDRYKDKYYDLSDAQKFGFTQFTGLDPVAGFASMKLTDYLMGSKPNMNDIIRKDLENLTASLMEIGSTLGDEINKLNNSIGNWTQAFYSANDSLKDALKGIRDASQGRQYLSSEGAMIDTVVNESDQKKINAAKAALTTSLQAWSNYVKSIIIISKNMIDEMTDYIYDLQYDDTAYQTAVKMATETWEGHFADAKGMLQANNKLIFQINRQRDLLKSIPDIDYAALRFEATSFRFDREGNFVREFNRQKYDRLVASAEQSRADLRQQIRDTIKTLERGLLTDDEIQLYQDVLDAQTLALEQVEKAFAEQRGDINVDIMRYMGELSGSATELDQALWDVEDRFDAWADALKETYDPIEQAVELAQEMARVEQLRADAIEYTTQQIQENIEVQEESALSIARAIAETSDLIHQLSGGPMAPVTSAEYYNQQYQTLLGSALAAPDEDLADAMSALNQFVPDYLSFMQAFGGYSDIVDTVLGDLSLVNQNAQTRADKIDQNWETLLTLTEQIMINTAGSGGLTNDQIYAIVAAGIQGRSPELIQAIQNLN